MSIMPVYQLECDSCGESSTLQFTTPAGTVEFHLHNGWTMNSDGDHFCPSCSAPLYFN